MRISGFGVELLGKIRLFVTLVNNVVFFMPTRRVSAPKFFEMRVPNK